MSHADGDYTRLSDPDVHNEGYQHALKDIAAHLAKHGLAIPQEVFLPKKEQASP